MSQFRKKPVTVTARQFLEDAPWPVGVEYDPDKNACFVTTVHEQRCYLADGDWVLPEPDGVHYYPVKDNIFKNTYESVDAPTEAPDMSYDIRMQIEATDQDSVAEALEHTATAIREGRLNTFLESGRPCDLGMSYTDSGRQWQFRLRRVLESESSRDGVTILIIGGS